MALYHLKPSPSINASQYAPGMQDGFTTFTSGTVDLNPIPAALERIAGFWFVETGLTSWTCSIPYVGTFNYLYPDDYVITPTSGPKTRMSKASFEAKYELDNAS